MGSLLKVTRIRKAALIICLLLFVFAPFVVHAQDATTAGPVVLVQPESVTVKEGDVFNVSVVIENLAANDGMCGADFVLTWNTTILNVLNITEVMFHSLTPQSEWGNIWQLRLTIDNTEGFVEDACTWMDRHRAIDIGYCPVNGISGNHTLAIITMEAVGAGSTTLQLPYVLVGDMNANALIDIERSTPQESNTNSSGNVTPPGPVPTPGNVSYPLPNSTSSPTMASSDGIVPTSGPFVASQGNATEVQKQDALEVTEVPFLMLATMSGVFIALPARWRRVRRQH